MLATGWAWRQAQGFDRLFQPLLCALLEVRAVWDPLGIALLEAGDLAYALSEAGNELGKKFSSSARNSTAWRRIQKSFRFA